MTLLAEYGFSEGSGSTTADSSGNGRNLAFSGSWATSAKNGSGLGSGGAAVGAMGPNTAQANYTIMAWVKLSLPSGGNFYGVVTSNTQSRFLEVSASGAALLLDYFGGTSSVNASSTFPVNTATHVAVVVTGSTSATLYINGVAASASTTVASTGANFSITDWTIGNGNGDIGPGASDWIDEVRIFDTALDAATITTWMNTPVGGGVLPVALVAMPPPPFVTPWRAPRLDPFQLRGDRTSPSGDASISVDDTATGADAVTVAATVTLPDTGAGSDAVTTAAAASLSDTATGADAVTVAAAPASLNDTATSVDALTVTVSVSIADTGAGTDAVSASATVPLADTASGSDNASVTVTTTIADTAVGADALSVQIGTDQNQAWPAVAWMFLSPNSASVQLGGSRVTSGDQLIGLPDTGTSTDALTTTASTSFNDPGSSSDAVSVAATVALTDTGSGTDALTAAAAVPLADTATAVDGITVTVTVALADTATGADTVGAGANVTFSDTTAGTDALGANATVTITDTGAGTDGITVSGSSSPQLPDTATATDAITVIVSLSVADTGAGADTLGANASLSLTDTAAGSDGISVSGPRSPSLPDTAAGTDAITVTVVVDARDITFSAALGIPTWTAQGGIGTWTGQIGVPVEISTLSKEFVPVRLSSSAANGSAAVVFDTQPVYLGLVPTGTQPQLAQFFPAEWVGVSGVKRWCRMLVGPSGGVATYATGVYDLYARVEDTSETAVRRVGQVTFV